ncbi:MAG: hypothetical protein AB7V16_13255, partial [Vulcanibacillus sp.]
DLTYRDVFGDSSTVEAVGKNLFDGELRNGSYFTTDGSFSTSIDNFANVNPIYVKPSTTYKIKDNLGTWNYILFYYDINGNFISYQLGSTGETTVTVPANCAYMNFRIYLASSGLTIPTISIQLEQGTTATDYEQYIDIDILLNDWSLYYEGILKHLYDPDNIFGTNEPTLVKFEEMLAYYENKGFDPETTLPAAVDILENRYNSLITSDGINKNDDVWLASNFDLWLDTLDTNSTMLVHIFPQITNYFENEYSYTPTEEELYRWHLLHYSQYYSTEALGWFWEFYSDRGATEEWASQMYNEYSTFSTVTPISFATFEDVTISYDSTIYTIADVDDSLSDGILDLGLGTFGYFILLAVISIVVTFLLVFVKAPMLIVLLINILIVVMGIVLGWLPVWFSILFGILLFGILLFNILRR